MYKGIDVLSDEYPLYAKMQNVMPGTLEHCLEVMSLISLMAKELNFDSQQIYDIEVAACYHDIGKSYYPICFAENADGVDIHKDLTPYQSYLLIAAHPAYTAKILSDADIFPNHVIRWASCHHGKDVVRYFFDKSGEDDENKYRYIGTIPQSIEDGMIMMSDQILSITRSLAQSNKLIDIPDTVISIIHRLKTEGQLDEVQWKVKEERILTEIAITKVKAKNHKRTNYDEAKKTKTEKKSKKDDDATST